MVVHFPIVFAVLLPIAAAVALWAARWGVKRRRAWAVPLVLAAALTLSAWAAVETGEIQEDRVEPVVAEAPLKTHEEAANRFLLLSIGVLAIMALGLAGGRAGALARGAGVVAALALTGVGYQVGHSGGELVYRHGAASAYANVAGAGDEQGTNGDQRERRTRATRGQDHDEE